MGTARQNGQQSSSSSQDIFCRYQCFKDMEVGLSQLGRAWCIDLRCTGWWVGCFLFLGVFMVKEKLGFIESCLCHEIASVYLGDSDQSFDSCMLTIGAYVTNAPYVFNNSTVYSCHFTTKDGVGQGAKDPTRHGRRRSIRPKSSTGSQFEWR